MGVLLLVSAAAGFPRHAAQAASKGTVSVQLKWRHQFQFAGYYAAIEKGFYREAGLEVKLLEGGPGMYFAEEVVSGRALYGVADPSLLIERANGKPVVVLAAVFQHSPEVLVVRRDSGVEALSDLAGKPVSLSTPGVLTVRAMLRKAGVGLDKIEIRQADANMSDLVEGRVVARACYLTDAPFILAQKDISYALFKPVNHGIDFYGDCLFTVEEEIRTHPERVEAFREASLRGWRYAMAHPEELIDLIVERFPGRLTRDQLTYEAEVMRSLMLPEFVEIGHMNPDRWSQISDAFVQLGLLRANVPLEGFLYRNKEERSTGWFRRAGFLAGLVILLAASGAAVLGFFNRKLRQTVRHQTAELHAVNQQLRAIFDNTFQFLGLLRPDGTLIEANRSALDFIGATLPQVAGKLFWNTPWWNHSPEMQERVKKAVEGAREGQIVRSEAIHLDAAGQPHMVEFSILPIRDESGRVVLLLPEGRDTTDRKRAEEAVLAERRLFVGGPVVVFHWRAEEGWPVVYASPNSLGQLGHRAEDFMSGRVSYASLLHPDDLSRVAGEVAAHSLSGVPFFEQEYRLRRGDGQYRWIHDFTVIERAEGGTITHYRGYVQDITERKRTEQELERSAIEWERTFDAVPDLVCLLDGERRIRRINRAMCERLGIAPEQAIGKLCLPKRDGEIPPDPCPGAVLLVENFEHAVEVELPELGGWFILSASPLRDEKGAVTGSVHMARDVTELKKAERTRTELEKRLAQAQRMEAIGRLAGGIAHDFNNILTVIIGGTALIKRSLVREDPLYRYVLEIEGAAERSRHITRQLLAFSRQQTTTPRVLDLNRSVRGLETTLLRLVGEDVKLVFELAPDLSPIRCDPGQIDQIILNLAVNSREAMPRGGTLWMRTSNVAVATIPPGSPAGAEPGDFVVLAVSDDGAGIDAETLPRIFEPFFTTKRLGQGTGLGLATVYGVVEQARGFIEVESQPGLGATFKIYFPRSTEAAEDISGAGEAETDVRRATVLLVEDEAGVRNVAASMLKALGYSVLVAAGPEEALEHCGKPDQPIDLVLSDVVMPGMSGPVLKTRIAEMRPGLPVLLMSGYPSDLMEEGSGEGSDAEFIQKPFSLGGLSAKIHRLMAPGPSRS